jgi:hypothetical protein
MEFSIFSMLFKYAAVPRFEPSIFIAEYGGVDYCHWSMVMPLEYGDGGLESESLRCSFILV